MGLRERSVFMAGGGGRGGGAGEWVAPKRNIFLGKNFAGPTIKK